MDQSRGVARPASPKISQLGELLRLRGRVTFRTYTATSSARLESLFFIPMLLLSAWGVHQTIFFILMEVLDPHTFFRSLSVNLVMLMHVTLLALFIGWSTVPALGFRTNEALDLGRLRLYPIPFRKLFAASVIGNILDVSTLLPFAMVMAILRFMVRIEPVTQFHHFTGFELFLLVLIGLELLVLLLLGSMAAVQVFMHLLPKVDFTKLAGLAFLGLLGLMIGLNLRLWEYPDGTTLFDELFIDRYNRLPTGPMAIALHELSLQNVPLVWMALGGGLLWIGGMLLLNWVLMAVVVEGRLLGLERWLNTDRFRGLATTQAARQTLPRWPVWVRHPTLVVAWKDWHSLMRDRYFFFYKMVPGVIAPSIILLAGKYNAELMRDAYGLMTWFIPLYLGLALMIFVAQANLFVANFFGFERDQIAALLTTPVDRRQMLWGKNLFLFAILLPDMLVIATFTLMLLSNPSWGLWVMLFTVLLSIVIVLLGLGNLASVLVPYFTPLDRPVITLQGAVLVGLVNTGILLALALLMVPNLALLLGPAYGWRLPWTYAITLPVWMLYNGAAYVLLTNYAAKLMPEYEEWIHLRVRGVL